MWRPLVQSSVLEKNPLLMYQEEAILTTKQKTKSKVIKDWKLKNAWWLLLSKSHVTFYHSCGWKTMKWQKLSAYLPTSVKLMKTWEGSIFYVERLAMAWTDDHTQKYIPITMMITTKAKRLFAILKEKTWPRYDAEFTASLKLFNETRIFIYYTTRAWERNLWVMMWRQLKEVCKLQVGCLWRKTAGPNLQYGCNAPSSWKWRPWRSSSIRKPSQWQVSKLFGQIIALLGSKVLGYKVKPFVILIQ